MDDLHLRLYVRLRHDGASSHMEPVFRELETRVAGEMGRDVAKLTNDELMGLLATDAPPAIKPSAKASRKPTEE